MSAHANANGPDRSRGRCPGSGYVFVVIMNAVIRHHLLPAAEEQLRENLAAAADVQSLFIFLMGLNTINDNGRYS